MMADEEKKPIREQMAEELGKEGHEAVSLPAGSYAAEDLPDAFRETDPAKRREMIAEANATPIAGPTSSAPAEEEEEPAAASDDSTSSSSDTSSQGAGTASKPATTTGDASTSSASSSTPPTTSTSSKRGSSGTSE